MPLPIRASVCDPEPPSPEVLSSRLGCLTPSASETPFVIEQLGGSLTLGDVVFADNKSVCDGGAVGAGGSVDAHACSFESNTAGESVGESDVAAGGQVRASRSCLTRNGAASGGAVASWGVSELIHRSLTGYELTSAGGAVSGPGDVTLLHTSLDGNQVPSGTASSAAQLQALNSLLVAHPMPTTPPA